MIKNSLSALASANLIVEDDGSFVVDISSKSANDKSNSLSLSHSSYQIYVRDIIGDNNVEIPPTLHIERTEGTPRTADSKIFQSFELILQRTINETIALNAYIFGLGENEFELPISSASSALLPGQMRCMGNYALESEQALLIRLDARNANYAVVPATNRWGGVGRFPDHMSSLNNFQCTADSEGLVTLVLALSDPGVPNWLDPGDMRRGAIVTRWIGLGDGQGRPKFEIQKISLSEVAETVGRDAAALSSVARAKYHAGYKQGYLRIKG